MYNYSQHLHFIGIGGVGMAGIAEVLLNLNYPLGGSDMKSSALTAHLESLGAKISIGHRAENLPTDTSVVIVSSAIAADNPELLEARRRDIPIIPRAEMLAELMRMKYGVAVAGSHGKTTTTSMTAKILNETGFDPTVIIGGRLLNQQSGANVGTGNYLVAEADESDGSFCLLRPAIAIVTNIDAEHLGHYGSFGALEEAFRSFMESVPFYGLVVACFDDPVVARVASKLRRRVLSYGLSPSFDLSAADIEITPEGSSFTLQIHGKEIQRVQIPMLGAHMVSNSLAAIAVGMELGAFPNEACDALASFSGVARRSELICTGNGVTVLDDYAHHPREIIATLGAIRRAWVGSRHDARLIAVFQPHRYSRTKELFSEFLTAFGDADRLIISDIYPAGEEPIAGISGESLAAAVQHPAASYCADVFEAVPILLREVKAGDVIVTIGAGSVGQVAQRLAEELKEKLNVGNI